LVWYFLFEFRFFADAHCPLLRDWRCDREKPAARDAAGDQLEARECGRRAIPAPVGRTASVPSPLFQE
jgi:hypothetical protein